MSPSLGPSRGFDAGHAGMGAANLRAMPDPVLEALWKRVTDDWDDARTHEAFLRHCQEKALLGEAAARYRPFIDDEVCGPFAKKRIEAITLLATSALMAQRQEPRAAFPKWVTIAVALACAATVVYLVGQIFS